MCLSKFLGETNDPVGFDEAQLQVKRKTGLVGQLTVAGKLGAADGNSPIFTGAYEIPGDALISVFGQDIDAFEITDRT